MRASSHSLSRLRARLFRTPSRYCVGGTSRVLQSMGRSDSNRFEGCSTQARVVRSLFASSVLLGSLNAAAQSSPATTRADDAKTSRTSSQPNTQSVVSAPPGTPGSTRAASPVSVETQPLGAASPNQEQDTYFARVSSQTFMRLFQRRYLVGPNNQSIDNETSVPIYQYASLSAGDLDAPWGRNVLSLSISAWGLLDLADVSQERRVTGDLTAANVTGRFGPGHVTLGRQSVSTAAARYTRFDGVLAGTRLGSGFSVESYAGLSAMPRFSSRPEYVMLGSRADSLLRDPQALPASSLTGYWLAGGRISYARYDAANVGLSFHEEHERGNLGRRWAAADVRLIPSSSVLVGGLSSFDVESSRLAEARGFVDVRPDKRLTTTLEVNHSNPSLFLSRTSVLSVFSLSTFTEVGADANLRVLSALSFGGSAHRQWFSDSTTGQRLGLRVRANILRDAAVAQLRYVRVGESSLGYHGLRASVSYALAIPVRATAEFHHYFYDQAIRRVRGSTYGSGTVEYGPLEQPWKIMLGGYLVQSPYAILEAQALARLSYDIDLATGGAR